LGKENARPGQKTQEEISNLLNRAVRMRGKGTKEIEPWYASQWPEKKNSNWRDQGT